MRHGIALLLAVILACGLMPASVSANDAGQTAQLNRLPVIVDDTPPRDPPGPDDIIYDDGNPRTLNTGRNYWSRVRFTPNSTFELRTIRFMPLNQGPNPNAPCQVRVYRENQDNGNLTDIAWQTQIQQLPAWNNQDLAANWQQVNIPEDDYVEFEGGETFTIMYGPAPGGGYTPGQQGTGWWNIFDGATQVNRSFLFTGANPSQNHRDWGQLTGDLLIRANGEYLEAFFDLAIVGLSNDARQWMMNPGMEQTYIANLANYGDDVDVAVINFQVRNSDGDPVWSHDVVVQDVASGDTVLVESDSIWVAPEDLGNYTVWASIQADEDANPDNDIYGMDQIVFNSNPDNGNPEQWLTYVDGTFESATNWNEDSGWCGVFYHPGGEQAYWITHLRVRVDAAQAGGRLQFGVNVLDVEARQFNPIWTGGADVQADGDQWIELELAEDDRVTFREGEGLMVTYFFVNGHPIRIDGTSPHAGTNRNMPWAMMQTEDDGEGYYWGGSGDYPIEVRIAYSDELPVGPHLRIVPEELDFGHNNPVGQAVTRTAQFIAIGDTSVTIRGIQISPSARPYFTVNPSQFTVASQETTEVEVTFRSDSADFEINTQFLVLNNSQNLNNFIWRIHASTRVVSVRENVQPGIPQAYNLAQNHPNPFNPQTTVDFALPMAGLTNLSVFDMNGRLVGEVHNGWMSAGYHSITLDAGELPAGIYIYRLTSGGFTSSNKMVLMK